MSADVLTTDNDTVFPLQAAFGYELAQTLFLSPITLLVEGPSDLIYLQLLNQIAEVCGLEGLDSRWVITPVSGASNLVTFISLIGANQLNVVVLIDSKSEDKQNLRNLPASGHLRDESLVQIGEFAGNSDADIEDLIVGAMYLDIINNAFEISPALTETDFTNKSPKVVVRIGEAFKEKISRLARSIT